MMETLSLQVGTIYTGIMPSRLVALDLVSSWGFLESIAGVLGLLRLHVSLGCLSRESGHGWRLQWCALAHAAPVEVRQRGQVAEGFFQASLIVSVRVTCTVLLICGLHIKSPACLQTWTHRQALLCFPKQGIKDSV